MKRLWIVQYKCGCSVGPLPRREILSYCASHGDDVQSRYPMPKPAARKPPRKKEKP
jgi:hypothetical protein